MKKVKDGASIAGSVKGPPDRRKPESNPSNYWKKVQKNLNEQAKARKTGKKIGQ